MFKIIKKLTEYINFNLQKTDIPALVILVLCVIYVKLFNITVIHENSLIETLSLIPLFFGIFICCNSKKHKVFFRIIALIFFLMIMRELSYGRVIFCKIPGQIDEFYPWSHYKYGFLAHIIIDIYIAGIFLYGILNKVWIDIINILKKVKLPFWTFLFSVILVITQIYCENIHNTIVEEISEFVLYWLMVSICLIYIKKLK